MKKIAIAGAGGIGSNVALHLVRTGVSPILIADFDQIEAGNLNRQFYFADQIGRVKVEALKENLGRVNPDCRIELIHDRLTADNIKSHFKDCAIIVEAFDNPEDKAMLLDAYTGEEGVFVISVSGIAGLSIERVGMREWGENALIIGDFVSDVEDLPTYSPKVSLVAALVANIVLEELGVADE